MAFRRSACARFASLLGVSCGAAGLLISAHALGTYSILAADRATLQVGGAGTSCINGQDVYIIYGSVPGIGAVHAQAQFSAAGRNRAVQLLGEGQSPEQIIGAISAAGFDGNAASRQYGVVDVAGRAAGFTGASTLPFADDVQGTLGTFTYSVQGNILTSSAVLSQARSAFEAPACDLAARLLAALEAGAANGEGDSRCTGDGIPSDSAYLQVDVPGAPAGTFLSLRVPTSGNDSPLPLLRAQFDAWRSTSPCPPAAVDAGAGDAAADPPASVPDASVGAPVSPDAPRPMGTGGAAPLDATPESPRADAGTSSLAATQPRRSRGGCSAAGDGDGPGAAFIAVCGVAALVARRRRF